LPAGVKPDRRRSVSLVLRFLPIGIGTFQSPNNSAIMGAVPRSRLGIASGLLAITHTMGQTVGIAILGALWAGRVMARAGQALPGGATTAPPAFQVEALNDTFGVTVILIGIALLLAVWTLIQERQSRKLADPAEVT